ncbi:gliding motility-associated C-terminal domain-containing protein [Mucilaginibacter sp.]|uniref:T9SS type B sorting domain-containing protein n=1 Tax=Mucilaginibacter sp. TaxID=1882438 RepID=UPI003B0071A8
MKKNLPALVFFLLILTCRSLSAQIVLGTSGSYFQNFDGLASGLPEGFTVRFGATASSLGTPATLTTAATNWSNTSGAFKNLASADGLGSTASTVNQSNATNRALGLRQTGTLGDPGGAFVAQILNTTGRTGFKLSFKLQSLDAASPRVATWAVEYGFGTNPTTFSAGTTTGTLTTGGGNFSNNTVTVNFNSALDNQNQNVWIRIVTLKTTDFSGNRPTSAIDDFSLTWTDTPIGTPTLNINPTAISFPAQNINTTSAAQTYTLSGSNLTGNSTITANAPFTISKDNVTFSETATYTSAELSAAKTVYVKFNPTATGNFSGTITNSSVGSATSTVNLSGTGVDPNNLLYNFDNCTGTAALADGWTQYSVAGAQVWACTTFGRDPSAPTGSNAFPYGVQINGYAGGSNNTNEDWLISPALNMTGFNYPLFSFWSRTAFNGSTLKLRVSTDYSGNGSPALATWTDIDAPFPSQASDTWTQTRNIDLSAYKKAGVYVAFVYNSTTEDGARWTLDDISLYNSPIAPPPAIFTNPTSVSFAYQPQNTASSQSFNTSFSNLTGNVTLTADNPAYTLSKDGITFATTINYTVNEASGTTKPVTVRFSPTQALVNYTGNIGIASPGVASISIPLSGNTYNPDNTLEVVNYNIEWFGSTQAGLGPTDKNLQEANIKTILSSIKADIFGLLEVVDIARLQRIVNAMPGYSMVVSDFGSYADNANDPDYGGAQKLAFVYKTAMFQNVKISDFLRCTEAQNCPDFNYWSSGRFPYVMDADVTLNGVTKHVTFVLIHAKANTSPTLTSYNRRKSGADDLKAVLDANYPGKNFVVLGDFNDDLNQTVTAGITPPTTSYSSFTNDPANYFPLTLPLSIAGKKSTVSYSSVIDNVIVSKTMNTLYVNGTAEVLNSVAGLVSNYSNTTTDHYPILTRYAFGNVPPTLNAVANQNVCYTNSLQTITLSGITAGPESGQTTTLSISNSNPGLIDGVTITAGSNGTGTINYHIGSNTTGLATITITVKDNGGTLYGGNDTFTQTLTIQVNALPDVLISSNQSMEISKGTTVNLTATGGQGYTWPGATDVVSGQNTATLTVRPKTNTTYKVTATNAAGCSSAQTITITVKDDYQLVANNVITPNGDGKNDTWVIKNIDYYPNNIVKVFDKAGRLVYQKHGYTNDWNGTYNNSPLTEGTYYYIIDFGAGLGLFKGYITIIRD